MTYIIDVFKDLTAKNIKRFIFTILIFVLTFSMCACGGSAAVEATPEPAAFSNNPEAIAAASKSVVMLTCYDSKKEPVCTGSALKTEYVTNHHVIDGVSS